jgi:hypothetical protein
VSTRLVPAVALCAALLAAAGCAQDPGPGAVAGDAGSSPAATRASAAVPSHTASVTAPTAVVPTASGQPSAPAATAGALDATNVPPADALGPGWRRYVDPGDAEEGYAGNGTWVRERRADEVVQAVVPLGCARLADPPALPRPRHALEGTYRGPRQAPAVALVLEFGSPARAAQFLAGMARVARSCPQPARRVGAQDPLVVVIEPVRVDASTVLDRRRELGAGASEWLWSEAVVRQGSRVGLLIVAAPSSARTASRPDLAALAGRLRTAVAS